MAGARSRSDTIYALASGRLPAGVAVIRISGPKAFAFAEKRVGHLGDPRQAHRRKIRAVDGRELDKGFVLNFPAPASYTGEDVVEIHLHGGKAVVAAVFADLSLEPGARPAEAGEFTHRAFLNGKLNLTQTEALADLISAETEAQRRFAVANQDGRLARKYSTWRAELLAIRSHIEAEIDFSDEGDVDVSLSPERLARIAALGNDIARHADSYHSAEILRDGFRVAIVGAPNSGKSSLINTLAKRDVAIVSDEPGTTRDVIEATLDVEGYKIIVSDTAGIRDAPGKVEAIGIERAHRAAESADLVIELIDLTTTQAAKMPKAGLRVGNKLDLVRTDAALVANFDLLISVESGENVDSLLSKLRQAARDATATSDVAPFRERHVTELRSAARLLSGLQAGLPVEVIAEDLRIASDCLGRITGAIDSEDILSAIFSEFCIGK